MSSEKVPPWLNGISGDALPILIESDENLIRVVSGPGSGKSLGLQRRIQRLIEASSVPPSKIYVGTFTRAIAGQLLADVGEVAPDDVDVSTLHSLAYKLLRENPTALGGRNLRILLGFEYSPMLYDIGLNLADGTTLAQRQNVLEKLQSDQARKREPTEVKFAGEIERWLIGHNGFLVEEIVPTATASLRNGDIEGGTHDHVLIDEYQDLTDCEQELVEHIWSKNGTLVVLGDDDQKIYGFRFNSERGISGFHERWNDLEFEIIDISIPENRRSGSDIVATANTMMLEAGTSKPPMTPQYPGTGTVTRVAWPTLEDEIEGLSTYLKAEVDKNFLVLVPRRLVGYRLQSAVGSDTETAFNQNILNNLLVQERFTLASLMANPDDRVALRTWLAFKGEQTEWAPRRNAEPYLSAMTGGLEGLDLVRSVASGSTQIKGTGTTNVKTRSIRLLQELEKRAAPIEEQIAYLFNPELVEAIEDREEKAWAARDLAILRDAALRSLGDAEVKELSDVMGQLRYNIATRQPIIDAPESRIMITTLHSAKGLQADSVIIAGLADQMLPGDFKDAQEREERRRLLYVSVTRAREELIISWPRQMALADAAANFVKMSDSKIYTVNGSKRLTLSTCTLLPTDIPGPKFEGSDWLKSVM